MLSELDAYLKKKNKNVQRLQKNGFEPVLIGLCIYACITWSVMSVNCVPLPLLQSDQSSRVSETITFSFILVYKYIEFLLILTL